MSENAIEYEGDFEGDLKKVANDLRDLRKEVCNCDDPARVLEIRAEIKKRFYPAHDTGREVSARQRENEQREYELNNQPLYDDKR